MLHLSLNCLINALMSCIVEVFRPNNVCDKIVNIIVQQQCTQT